MSDTVPSLPAPESDPTVTRPAGTDTAPMQTPAPDASSVAEDTLVRRPAAAADETLINPPAPPDPPPPAPPAGPPSGPSAPPPSGGQPLGMLLAVFGLVLVGIVLLGLGIFAVMRLTAPAQVGGVTATTTTSSLPTQVVVIPTTTPQPTATDTPQPTATATEAPPTATNTAPAATGTAGAAGSSTPAADDTVVTIIQGANVRGGPGTNYDVIGGIKAGDTAPVIGMNAARTWYAIDFGSALEGRAWVSGQVATYAGDDADLPVIAAPPPPPPSPTPKPASNPAPGPVAGTHGVSGQLTMCGGRLSFAVNERVCFVEWIKNTTAAPISYGVLGVIAVKSTGGTQFQTSWDAQGAASGLLWIDPGCVGPTDRCNGPWEDGMRLPSAGSWRLSMQVCFSDFTTCLNGGDWETLSAPITISVN
ncbi:MAG: SH3 domain-containing protein [Anaerolineales bacterium]|nr:SH3 domain-containing protein [Anaerolineales bacterium]